MDKLWTVLIAGLIGYFTNYLAIKMLFRPLTEKRILKIKLPFTPGIIPKNREVIQKSLSKTISDKLLNKDDLIKAALINLKSDNNQVYFKNFIEENTIGDLLLKFLSEDKINEHQVAIKNIITNKIIDKYHKENLGFIMSEKIIDNFSGNIGLMKPFLNGLKPLVKTKIDEFVNHDLETYIKVFVEDMLIEYKLKRLNDIKIVNDLIDNLMFVFIEKLFSTLFEKVNIEKIIYQKVNDLDILEFEKLLLNIIKKELRMLTYLGGVLGILIGLINIFII